MCIHTYIHTYWYIYHNYTYVVIYIKHLDTLIEHSCEILMHKAHTNVPSQYIDILYDNIMYNSIMLLS